MVYITLTDKAIQARRSVDPQKRFPPCLPCIPSCRSKSSRPSRFNCSS